VIRAQTTGVCVVRSPALALLGGAIGLAAMLTVWHAQRSVFDNYYYLADALRHGHTWIAWPGDYIDAMPYHGRAYIVEGPLPALLLLPAVLIWGQGANETILANLLGALSVVAAWRLCDRVGLSLPQAAAASAFAFFGTSQYVCAAKGDVWQLAHASAYCFTLLALAELLGRRRAWLVALWGVCAAFSRYPLVVALPLYLAVLLYRQPRAALVASFLAPLVPAGALAVLYDESRWGTILDRGYSLFYRVMDASSKVRPAVFSLAYLPGQLRLYFDTPPKLTASPPFVIPRLFGMSLQWTSLPFVYAVCAPLGAEMLMLWAAALATAIPALTYYGAGDIQYGVRHALDFEPFVFALMVLGLHRRPSTVMTIALVAFALLGFYAGSVWLLVPDAMK